MFHWVSLVIDHYIPMLNAKKYGGIMIIMINPTKSQEKNRKNQLF